MSTPQAKRRRLNDATKTLHKPFKSPFRTPLKPNLGSDPLSSDPPEISTPSVRVSDSGIAQEHLVSNRPTPDRSTANLAKSPLPRSGLPPPTRPRLSQKKSAPSKPSLTREIIELRNDIQILSQAHALTTSSKDDDLFVLVERWRTASRAAAEELFASTRDRVNRMGGVGAWKDREREQKEWKIKAEREDMEAEREKLEEARENGEVSEEAYEQYADAGVGAEQEEKETCKAADDDVSRLRRLAVMLIY
jgi:Swi5-dependent recombination DNA repair protein 1